MALHNVGRDRIERGVSKREAFKHGNVSARWHDTAFPMRSVGQLPREFEIPAGESFVVYSYATPIAWWTPSDGWFVPVVRYSATTTNHQAVTRGAISRTDEVVRA